MATVLNEEAINDALRKTFTANSKRGYVLLGYRPGSPTEIELQDVNAQATVADLVTALQDNQVQYALIRIPYQKEAFIDDAVRDVLICWAGARVGKVEKCKKRTHTGLIKALLVPHHADLEAISKDNFTEDVVMDRSAPLSGSHVID